MEVCRCRGDLPFTDDELFLVSSVGTHLNQHMSTILSRMERGGAALGYDIPAIAARYGLALHTERQAIENAGDQSREHGAYEDGSFHISVSAVVEQKRYLYELYLEKNGCLPCDDMTAGAAREYEEWECTTGRGDKVSIAVRDVSTNGAWAQYELLVFYSGDGAVMTVRASYGCQRGDSDEKLFAERLADSIDFSAAAGADTPEEAVLILRGN